MLKWEGNTSEAWLNKEDVLGKGEVVKGGLQARWFFGGSSVISLFEQ